MKKFLLLLVTSGALVSAFLYGHQPQRPHRGHRPAFTREYKERHHGKGLTARKLFRGEPKYDFFHDFPRVDLPDSIDLRALYALAPVLDQGQAGTCWAHSLVETLWDSKITTGNAPASPLSVQYLVDAAGALGYGCNGGNMDASRYLIAPQGAPSAVLYLYSDQNCSEQPKSFPVVASAANFIEFEPSDYNMMYVLSVLKQPVSMTVAAGAGGWEQYGGGTYKSCTMATPDHMIELVGIDRYGGAFDASGNLPYGVATGTAKNSWSVKWGEGGFIETVLRDASGRKCNNFTQEVGYFVVDGTPPGPLPSPPTPAAPACGSGFLCGIHCWSWCQ
jgi:hypothetical protein